MQNKELVKNWTFYTNTTDIFVDVPTWERWELGVQKLPDFHNSCLTLCEATARSTKLRKKAILSERLLSEKRSAFAYYNLTLSESFCLTDHEKQVEKFVAH